MKISSGGWKIRVNWSREKRKSFSQSFDTAPTLRALILKDSLIRDLRQVDRSDEEKVFLSKYLDWHLSKSGFNCIFLGLEIESN